jgi:hypothetical protein
MVVDNIKGLQLDHLFVNLVSHFFYSRAINYIRKQG